MSHGQEEARAGVRWIIGLSQVDSLFQVRDRPLPVAGSVAGDAESVRRPAVLGAASAALAASLYRPLRIAKFGVWNSSKGPGQVIHAQKCRMVGAELGYKRERAFPSLTASTSREGRRRCWPG